MTKLDNLDKLFVVWAFLLQIVLIVHFAIRKPLFESYTVKYGWIVYALCIPAVVISIVLMRGGEKLVALAWRIPVPGICHLWLLG